MTLAAPEHQEMNGQVEVTQRTLRTIARSPMVHDRVLEAYIHFALMFTTYNIFLVLLIKDLIKNTAIRPRYLNLQQVRNLQYQIIACYFVYVFYVKLLQTLTKRL